MPDRDDRLTEQRRALPDSPGVYLFKDAGGRVLYVGKAKSIRKRVASHFGASGTAIGSADLASRIDSIDFVGTGNEAEALLAEQNFIKQHRPAFNIRLRDDKSYPYIGISLDEEFPRVYFTRERHRPGRAYFGPFSSAKRVRETLDLLGKLFPYRTCEGPEPGRASGNPCLDYYIKRCQAPCVGYISQRGVPREHRRDRRLPLGALPADRARARGGHGAGGRRAGVRAGRGLPQPAARGALAVRAPARRARVGRHARRDRGRGRRDRRQRAGVPGPRRRARRPPELLSREPRRPQRGRGRRGVRRAVLRDLAVDPARDRRPGLARIGGGAEAGAGGAPRGPGRAPPRAARRQAADLRARGAQRAARARAGQAQDRAPAPAARRRSQRPARGARRWRRCRCGSSASTSPTSVRRTPSPRWSCSREERRRSPTTGASRSAASNGRQDDFAALEEVLARRMEQFRRQRELSPHDVVTRRELRGAARR